MDILMEKIEKNKLNYTPPELVSLDFHNGAGSCGTGSTDATCTAGDNAQDCNSGGLAATIPCSAGTVVL